jgi:hypothetical protein
MFQFQLGAINMYFGGDRGSKKSEFQFQLGAINTENI